MGSFALLLLAVLAIPPAVVVRLSGLHLAPVAEITVFGLAILGAAFLLSWGTEVAQLDIPRGAALAVLALIAVLPEYAVDLYFAYSAAGRPEYSAYALANMTGANRMLVGAGWSLVVFLAWLRRRARHVALGPDQPRDVAVLALATVYAVFVFIKGSLAPWDALVLVGLFALYLWLTTRAGVEEPELVGPAVRIAALPTAARRLVVLLFFLYAGAGILAAAEPFAESLIRAGVAFGIDEFLLVQWLAPVASEAPELIVAALLVWRGQTSTGLGALVSSKVNQWTLLVGTLPLAYSLGLGRPGDLVLDPRQAEELLLTAAQSLFAVAILLNRKLTLWEAGALALLFFTQAALPDPRIRAAYIFVYFALSLCTLVIWRRYLGGFLRSLYTVPAPPPDIEPGAKKADPDAAGPG